MINTGTMQGMLEDRLEALQELRQEWQDENPTATEEGNDTDQRMIGHIEELKFLIAFCKREAVRSGPATGAEIRRLRRAAGVTQGRMAQGVGMSRTQLSQIETGRQNLTRNMAARINVYLTFCKRS